MNQVPVGLLFNLAAHTAHTHTRWSGLKFTTLNDSNEKASNVSTARILAAVFGGDAPDFYRHSCDKLRRENKVETVRFSCKFKKKKHALWWSTNKHNGSSCGTKNVLSKMFPCQEK